jgi:hypothetical protein
MPALPGGGRAAGCRAAGARALAGFQSQALGCSTWSGPLRPVPRKCFCPPLSAFTRTFPRIVLASIRAPVCPVSGPYHLQTDRQLKFNGGRHSARWKWHPPAIARSRRQWVLLAPLSGRGTESNSLQVLQSQAEQFEQWSLRFGLSHKLTAHGTASPLRPRGG